MRINHLVIIKYLIVLFLGTSISQAQLGGTSSYSFLNLVNSSRVFALGGSNVSLSDGDANLLLSNPSFIDSTMSGAVSLNYMNYIGDINYGFASYTQHFKKVGTFNMALMYANYGDFIRTDVTGEQLGNFYANDMGVVIGYGTRLDSLFSIGANFKVLNSVYDTYTSVALSADIAGSYYSKKSELGIGVVLKNVGYVLKKYTDNAEQNFPIELQAGITKKLKHAPIRLSLTLTNLQKWDLTYEDPNAEKQFDPETFEELPPKEPTLFDKTMRHVVLGGEILLSKNFHIQLAFNHRRRKELGYSVKGGLVGFSTGMAFKIKQFRMNYSMASYHLAGASHNFSVTTNIHDFRSK
jgi:hypothetical protein